MKIRELIEELQKYDPETLVVTRGYEDGYDGVTRVRALGLSLVTNPREWEGDYESSEFGSILAVHLSTSAYP